MKKRVSIAFILCLLLGLFPACRSGETGSSTPKLAAEAQKEKDASSAQREEGAEVLRVLTDFDCLSRSQRQTHIPTTSQAKWGKQTFASILKHFGGTPNGMEVELEVLPTDQELYQAQLTHLRTEIMSGAGPDVFHMSGFGGGIQGLPESTLFPNPENAMASGFFLPLDEYVENARFMELDKLQKTVMDAGCYKGSRYILPMFYRLPVGLLRREEEPGALPASWDEAVASPDGEIRQQYARAAEEIPGFRETAFGRIADNAGQELLISQEELFARTKEALSLVREFSQGPKGREIDDSIWYLDYRLLDSAGDGAAYTFFTPRNPEGGVNAPIETWCAVNKNTSYPEDAFSIVDMMLSRDFLSAEIFWETRNFMPGRIELLGYTVPGALPVCDSLMLDTPDPQTGIGWFFVPDAEQRKAFQEAEKSVNCAYFTSNLDREIDRMFMELADQVYAGEEVTDEEIRKAAGQCYSTLKMMLAES